MINLAAGEDVDIRREIRSTAAAGESPGVRPDKMEQLVEMYDRWIDDKRRLEVLPARQHLHTSGASINALAGALSEEPVTSLLAEAHQATRTRRKCSVPGCSGVGHKNPAAKVGRWSHHEIWMPSFSQCSNASTGLVLCTNVCVTVTCNMDA